MNIYHKKQRWKIALILIAGLMVAISLWFSFNLVNKVQQREVDRVHQWADAVKKKSELVNLTNNVFEELKSALGKLQQKERQKVEMWSRAMAEINKPLNDYSFPIEIIRANKNIPMIITDLDDNVTSTHNLSQVDSVIRRNIETEYPDENEEIHDSIFKKVRADSVESFIKSWPITREPLEIDLFYGEKQKVIYFDSILIRTSVLNLLEQKRDSLVQSFGDEIVANEYLVPVLFVNSSSRELIATNMADYDSTNLSTLVDKMALNNDSILVDLGQNNNGVIYYQHSPELSQMKYFPFIQFFIIGLFVLIAYVAFSSFRKAEQDQVWVGMAKETAHQLGTPISSLMAWNQLLEAQGVDQNIIVEMNKDIERLNTVTNRFSKIGSDAILKQMNLVPIITKSVDYLKLRISAKIDLSLSSESDVIMANVNSALLEWVIENITKNAVDSMEGKGKIGIELRQVEDEIQIDITDTGKGIPANKLKTVFQPGYTTKKRGWGLGLSLVKRIVEDFHNGKVYVLKSELDKGTTFRLTFQV